MGTNFQAPGAKFMSSIAKCPPESRIVHIGQYTIHRNVVLEGGSYTVISKVLVPETTVKGRSDEYDWLFSKSNSQSHVALLMKELCKLCCNLV